MLFRSRIDRLKELEALETNQDQIRTKKELLIFRREKDKLKKNLDGIRNMSKLPSAIWVVDTKKEQTTWRPRPSDPNLEAEMLSRLMVKLGATKDQAAAAKKVAAAPTSTATAAPAMARLDAAGTTLSVDADFDTTWRRVGLALDRSGFTVENRDRKQGFYEVRLSDGDPEAKKPGFWASLFSSSKQTSTSADGLIRYRVQVQGQSRTNAQVVVTDDKGSATTDATAKRIANTLLGELR